jgi:virulence-associated protein VapD
MVQVTVVPRDLVGMDVLNPQVGDAAVSLPPIASGRAAWVPEPPDVRQLMQRPGDAGLPLIYYAGRRHRRVLTGRNQAALARHYPGTYPQNAYDDICRELAAHRFQRQQGSVYFGGPGTNPGACVLVVQAVAKRYPWFRHVVSDIRMLRIEENNDLMPAVGQGELPLDKPDAA